jgi:hypothetical protein
MDVNFELSRVSDNMLIAIGKRVCSSDFAVRFFKNKGHPKFYQNRDALEKSIRRAYAIGAFQHRAQIVEMLEDNMQSLRPSLKSTVASGKVKIRHD